MLQAYYTECEGCGSRFRIERLEPQTKIGVPPFCPQCGNQCARTFDAERDQWYTLAQAYGYEASEAGANLIRQVYSLWDGREYRSFRQFVEAMRQ